MIHQNRNTDKKIKEVQLPLLDETLTGFRVKTSFDTTRYSNTASDSHNLCMPPLQASVDWLGLSFESVDIDRLLDDLQQWIGIIFFFEDKNNTTERGKVWTYYQGSDGCSIGINLPSPGRIGNVRLVMPGEFMKYHSPWHVQSVARRLREQYGARCRRIDIKVDDYERKLDFVEIEEALHQGNFSGFKEAEIRESIGCDTAGKTIYLGTRRSARFGRIYDKFAQTKGVENCIRYEVEYKQGAADIVFYDYISSGREDFGAVLARVLRGSFDFVEKKDKNISRSTRLDWWESFLDRISAEGYRVVAPKRKPSIEATVRWIKRSVSKSLLIMQRAFKKKEAAKILNLWQKEAATRLTERDRFNILEFLKEGYQYKDLVLEF